MNASISRLVVASLLLTGVSTTLSGADLSEMMIVPGGTKALSLALQIDPVPDRARFASELARLVYQPADGVGTGVRSRPATLTRYFDALERFRAALSAFEQTGGPTLAAASDPRTRDRLAVFLDVVGLRLRQDRGQYIVDTSNDADGFARARLLAAVGVDAQNLAAQLNAGRTVALSIAADTVPVPLSSESWAGILGAKIAPDRVFEAIMRSESLALLAHGLAGLDDETLQYVRDHPRLLAGLKDDAAIFAAFAGNFRVRDSRVVPAGGAVGRAVWEATLDQPATEPERFARALFGGDGRRAYLYDLIAELDEPHQAFVLGSWMPDTARRSERFKALMAVTTSAFPEWRTRERPFKRPANGIAVLFTSVAVRPDGSPAFPGLRRFWDLAFASDAVTDDDPNEIRGIEKDGLVDAARLAEATAPLPPRERADRVRQIAFGFRVFRTAQGDSAAAALVAVRALPTYATLLLTLERMGVTAPAVYASAARRAQRLAELDGARAHVALGQFQGALAVIARLHAVGAVADAQAEGFASSLVALELTNGNYGGAVAGWIRTALFPAPQTTATEDTLLAALAGMTVAGTSSAVIAWEGDRYRLDLAAAELAALKRARASQNACTLDTALALNGVSTILAAPTLDIGTVEDAVRALTALHDELPAPTKDPSRDGIPAAVRALADPRDVIAEAIKELSKINKPKDAQKARRWAWPLAEVADVVLADALSSLAYTVALAPVVNAGMLKNAARRHDFGLAGKDALTRTRSVWALPRATTVPGIPWHITGSLLAMDVAIAPRMLRRVSVGVPPAAPALISSEVATFELSVALLNPFRLTDRDRDAVKRAIDSGRRRVESLSTADVGEMSRDIKLDGWRQRALQWNLDHDPATNTTLFSLTELLVLGGGDPAAFGSWGMSITALSGCLCSRLPAPNNWRLVIGEPQLGSLATAVPDLHLRVALALADWQLPGALARLVLSAATQDFLERVRLADSNDWLSLVRAAQHVQAERLEDYVAAAVIAGGPLVRDAGGQSAGR